MAPRTLPEDDPVRIVCSIFCDLQRRLAWLSLVFVAAWTSAVAYAAADPPIVTVQPRIETMPLPPAWTVDVRHIDEVGGQNTFTQPFLPPLTTSRDQRVGLVRKRVGARLDKARFHLIAPERLADELMVAGPGPTALSPTVIELEASRFYDGVGQIAHFALCDAAELSPVDCAQSPGRDCYELTVIAGVIDDSGPTPALRLWSTPITVEVTDPKQGGDPSASPPVPAARLADITVHVDQQIAGMRLTGFAHPSPSKPGGITTFHTPMIVGEGSRLLIVRFGFGSYFSWTDSVSAQSHLGEYDPVYAVYPEGQYGACDVRGWTNFKPLSYAPRDPAVNQDYGFAALDYRQPDGTWLNPPSAPPGDVVDLPGRYLWVDQDADNVFFASLSQPLLDRSAACQDPNDPAYPTCRPLYAVACGEDPGCDEACLPGDAGCLGPQSQASESTAPHQGWMAMGLWTNGKMVLLDNAVNHTDFGLAGEEEHHRAVTLYASGDGPPEEVAVIVGTGRDDADIPPNPYGWIDTTVQFGSTEHFLNVDPQMVPRTPRDVVWQISAGSRTAEIAFDDLISQRTLIYSPMNAVKMMTGPAAPYYDGVHHPEMRLQNAATSLAWQTPAYGQVVPEAGSTDQARIEHVALGGIEARGFYLFPQTRIDYAIADQPGLDDEEWLLSVFVDPRNVPASVRRLVTLPNDAYIDLHGIWWTRLCTVGDLCTSLRLQKPAAAGQWVHLAYRLQPADAETGAPAKVHLYQDGFVVDSVTAPEGFSLGAGVLSVGAPRSGPTVTTQGVEGWIDDFKVISGPFSPEEVCNHARGSLVAVPHDYLSTTPPCMDGGPCARDLLQPFALETLGREAVHRALHGDAASIGDPLTTTADHYLCLVDYGSPDGISLADLEDGVRPLRRRLLFPEGPLVWNQPRPDSLTNDFCLACHHAGSPKSSLLPSALALDPSTPAHADARRQPNQPEAAMHGWVPAEYFDELQPMTSFAYDPQSPEGILDRYLDNGPLFRWTFDEAAGDTVGNWVLGRPGESTGDGTIHDATFAGGVETAGTARGHALDFDGSAHVTIDQSFDIADGELTLAGWFRLATGAESDCRPYVGGKFPCTLIAKSGAGTHALWSLRVFHDSSLGAWKVQFKVSADATNFESISDVLDTTPATSTVDFDPAAWHHLAAVYSADAGVMELYLDGVPLKTSPTNGVGPGASATHGVTLGARLDGFGNAVHTFVGRLDELHVFDRRLLAAEIEELVTTAP